MSTHRRIFHDIIPWVLLLAIPFGDKVESVIIVFILLIFKWENILITSLIATLLFLHAVPTIIFHDYPSPKVFQQILLISAYIIGYSTFFKKCVPSVDDFWKKYMLACLFFSYLSLIEYVVYLINGTDIFYVEGNNFTGQGYFLRVHAYFQEPGYFAAFLSPSVACILISNNYKKNNIIQSLVILITYCLTISAVAYVIIACSIGYRLCISKYKIILLSVLSVASIIIISSFFVRFSYEDANGPFEQSFAKICETADAFTDLTPQNFEKFNYSTYATTSNLYVATKAPSRLFGAGIGSHVHSYESLYHSNFVMYGLNKADAFSLLTRIFSEFGIIGVVIVFFSIVRIFNKSDIINVSTAFYIISCLVRGGHYTYNGVFLFIFLYIYTSSFYENRKSLHNYPSIQ